MAAVREIRAALAREHGPSVEIDGGGGDRWVCPTCLGGLEDPMWRPLVVHDDGRLHCDDHGCAPTDILRELGIAPARRRVHRVDMAAELRKPVVPVRYRVDRLAQDGALTVVCGAGGAGKSWLGMALCAGVQAGTAVAGIEVDRGRAVYVDGEMGTRQMADRFRSAGFTPDAFGVLDVQGLDLSREGSVIELQEMLGDLRADFFVLDSLRRLSPGKAENDSDDMAPLVGRLAVMSRELGAAGVLLHHSGKGGGKGDGSSFARGSSAIGDQADALFGYVIHGEDRTLSCDPNRGGKFRMGPEPADRVLRPVIGASPGVVVVAGIKKNGTTTTPSRVEALALRIPGLITDGNTTRRQLAAALETSKDNQSLRDALRGLEERGKISRIGDGYRVVVAAGPSPGTATTPPLTLVDGEAA